MYVFLLSGAVLALLYSVYAAVNGKKQALALVFGPVERAQVEFETLELKPSPNQFLVCPPGLCRQAQAHLEPPSFDLTVEQLCDRWREMVSRQPRVSELSADPVREQYEYEQLSALVGYPDTITVRFLPAGEGRSTLAIYSRSHYGRSDLGVNEKRIRAWLDLL